MSKYINHPSGMGARPLTITLLFNLSVLASTGCEPQMDNHAEQASSTEAADEDSVLDETRIGPSQDQAMLDRLSRATGIDRKDLVIESRTHKRFEELEREVERFVVSDRKDGSVSKLALDVEHLQRVNYASLLARDRQLASTKYGRATPDLIQQAQRQLRDAQQSGTVAVVVKMAMPEKDGDLQLNEARIEAEFAAARQGFVELFADGYARVPAYQQSGPFFAVELSAEQILDLAHSPEIAFIGPRDEEIVYDGFDVCTPWLNFSMSEAMWDTETNVAHHVNNKGSGVNIAVLERGMPRGGTGCYSAPSFQIQNPNLNPSQGEIDHASGSLGIIGHNYNFSADDCTGALEGYAPEANVLYANNLDSDNATTDYMGAYTGWVLPRNPHVVTMSWHPAAEETQSGLSTRDVYFDYWVNRPGAPFVVVSAGNQAATNAYASGKGYNFFGVGNVAVYGDGSNCVSDRLCGTSSRRDPSSAHGDREIPEIAAPGDAQFTPGTGGGYRFGGTSAATPVVASIAALTINAGGLHGHPHAVRAILLATADDQRADGLDWRPWSSHDGGDGTGIANAHLATHVASYYHHPSGPSPHGYQHGIIQAADVQNGWLNHPWTIEATEAGATIRAAFTWNSKTTGTSSSVLDADFDLVIEKVGGGASYSSSSWDSNYEFIEFQAPQAGLYELRVRGYSVPSGFSRRYGIAWTQSPTSCS